MTPELKAAAERVRAYLAQPKAKRPYSWQDSTYANDCEILAQAYLAEHQADDGEPVTEKQT